MKNNDYGLLYDAAVAWKELTEYYYVFTFGYKQQLYTNAPVLFFYHAN